MVDMLHNMSMRPSTRVEWGVQALWDGQACFNLKQAAAPRGFLYREGEEVYLLTNRRRDCLLEMMQDDWRSRPFTGAVLMYTREFESGGGVRIDLNYRSVTCVTEPLLVLNVLARTRGGVLLYDAPAWLDRDRLERSLYTFDPRFTALAGRKRRRRNHG
ncbi:MAG: hypothetical protein IFK94_15865 [Acidobacteria bacterium]|uniref:Uncharacterized protein n=1 Tax=Candidatus Polarisedimenticola svalbardensis TaxID=2886004 RepID=A0A8J7CE03_9BACT|nr:hypothetical protein [Candidatus Polarisedimenticola svalbardensis]